MRKLVFAASLAGMALLLCFSGACLSAARTAIDLFVRNVLPTLFPFYVCTAMLYASGALQRLAARARSRLLPCFLIGMHAGFPSGARLCGLLGKESRAACCNLCSPVFLMSVVAVGLCGNAQLFFPLAIAHWGSGLLTAAALAALSPGNTAEASSAALARTDADLLSAIAEGMDAMLRILGCMLFFCVASGALSELLHLTRFPAGNAALAAFFEITAGCNAIVSLGLPSRLTCALLSACVSFGGLCVFAQAKLVAPRVRALEYLLQKCAQAVLAALLAWWITPAFVSEQIPVFSPNAQIYAENAALGAALIYSSAVGLAAVYLIAVCVRRARSQQTRQAKPLPARRAGSSRR